jgi:hypothetical protein
VHSAIARASAATGVDFNYLLAQAKLESGLDSNARAGTSSAAGLYQFIGGTWLETLDRHGSNHGLGWADSLISRSGGRANIADPAARAEVLALRFDPNVSALMAAELARDNAAELGSFLGREPDSAELYLAHFLGSGGAKSFLGALQESPQATAAGLFPKQAAANRPIFYDGARPRAVGEVMDLLRSKVAAAMEGGAALPPPSAGGGYTYSPVQASFTNAAASFAEAPASARRPSMAETLQATFGGAAMDGRAAQRIGDAYGKFKAFGL